MNDWYFALQLIVCYTIATILTVWFLMGRLNAFITATTSIIKCGFTVVLGFIIPVLIIMIKPFVLPIKWILDSISFLWSVSLLRRLLLVGLVAGILLLDHLFSLKMYEMDQTEFTKLIFFGETYWITNVALTWASIFGGAGVLILTWDILWFLWALFDLPIRITIKVNH